MPLNVYVRRFLDALAAGNAPGMAEVPIERRRAQLAELMALAGPSATIERREEQTLPGPAGRLPIRIYTPHDSPSIGPGLVYFHGGGLVAGSLATHEPLAMALAAAGHCRVISVEYALGPEHRFPAAVEDALAAVHGVIDAAPRLGLDDRRIGVCGDSAGATLAATTCAALAAGSGAPLALQVLLCPILDHSRPSASRREFASGYLVDQATLADDLRHYLPAGADLADPRISPLRARSLAGTPRTIIHTAEFDPLRDEGRDYAERLRHEQVTVSYTCHPGMIHLFYGLGAVIPQAGAALDSIGREIRAVFETGRLI